MNDDIGGDYFPALPESTLLTREDLENQVDDLKTLLRKAVEEIDFLLITGGWETTPEETTALLDRARKASS